MSNQSNRTGDSAGSSDQSFEMPEEHVAAKSDSLIIPEKNLKKNQITKRKSRIRKPFAPVKPRRKLIQKYFTDGKKVTEDTIVDFDKEPCPFRPPDAQEIYSHKVTTRERKQIIQNRELRKPVHMKLSAKGNLNNNLFDRLYVKVPPPDGTRTVIEYDSDYHQVVKGRPTADIFNIREYIQTVREVLKTNILIGYREDDIMLMNQNLINEQKALHHVTKNLNTYTKAFDNILARDHMTAARTLKEADDVAAKLFDKNLEFKTLRKSYNSMKAGLYSSEEKWSICKTYQKFLFYISPLHWKKANFEQVKEINMSEEISTNEEEHMFDEKSLESRETSVETMLENIKRDCKNAPKPKLYFKHPQEILDIFNYMETQNLSYLLHAEDLAFPLENIKNGMDLANSTFDRQITNMNNSVIELAKAIEWEEHKAVELEEMALSLIYNEFKDLIMATDVLNLQVFIEDVYETRIGSNDANFNLLQMMTAIEMKYRADLLTLDKVPHEIVASLEGSCFTEQMKMMKLAEKAVKQFSELDILTKQLKRAYAPKYEKGRGKEAKNRSKFVVPPKPKPPPPIKLTQQQEEYLEFFTDFCKYTDDPEVYGIENPSKRMSEESVKPPPEKVPDKVNVRISLHSNVV